MRRGVRFRERARAWIRGLAPARAGSRVPVRARIPASTGAPFPMRGRAAFRTPASILASARSGSAVPTRAGAVVRARAGIPARTHAVFLAPIRAGCRVRVCGRILVLILVGFRALGRAGAQVAIRAVVFPPALGSGLARNLVMDGRGDRVMVRRPDCRFPPRLARRLPKITRARGGPGMPIKALARAPAAGPGRIPVPGQAAANPERIPGPVAGRRPGSARAPMPRSGRGPGLTSRRRCGAGRAPTAWHGRVPHAVLARRRPACLGPRGLKERSGQAANPAPARANKPPAGTAAADRSVLPTPRGRATGVPDRAPAHCRLAPARPCLGRPPARGAGAATVPTRARMRAGRRKRSRGTRVRDAAAAGAAALSRPPRIVRPRWAAMSCWTALRRPAAT